MRFNAHHAPIGAYATFTLGAAGRSGGFALEAGMPPNQDVLIGARAPDGGYEALPFFDEAPMRRLDASREFGVTSDAWEAPGIRLRILSPLRSVPEPGVASEGELRDALLPAVLVELTVDNTAGTAPRRAFFGVHGATRHRVDSPWGPTPRLTRARAAASGFVLEDGAGRMAGAFCSAAEASAAAGSDVSEVLDGPAGGAGDVGALRFEVPARRRATYRIAVAFWHGGEAAAGPGIACSYWYTRLFDGLEHVADHALEEFERLANEYASAGAELDGLPEPRRLQLAHALRSYYGNTALLAARDRPLWAVMEGEFMFVNTLDLAVDQLFHELRQSPWTVRNELDSFLSRHSYEDGSGIAFTHDMGSFPTLAAPGTSAYERRVHMTGEQVTNWTLTALAYVAQTGDRAWADRHADTLERCLRSLVARSPGGVPRVETDRRGADGEEITTFDSLDASLRQARRSSYLAGKQWAACVSLAAFFGARGREDVAAAARRHAAVTADRLAGAAEASGYVPALVADGGEPADAARVIPAVEGLAFALFAGAPEAVRADGAYGAYLRALRRHLERVLQPGICLFDDGGWKLSSADDNSWLSKIYIAQFVARRILGLPTDATADGAHVGWLTNPELAAWAWSDQMLAGRIHSSRYYPRGVTAALWLEEDPATARLAPRPGG
jgi:xylan 1,4-beta-xylosidase